VRVGASEGAHYLERDETGNGERVALKGRNGRMTDRERAKGVRDGREIQGGKKYTRRGREKQRRADSPVKGE